MNIYDFSVENINGDFVSLKEYEGKAVDRFEPTADFDDIKSRVEALL